MNSGVPTLINELVKFFIFLYQGIADTSVLHVLYSGNRMGECVSETSPDVKESR